MNKKLQLNSNHHFMLRLRERHRRKQCWLWTQHFLPWRMQLCKKHVNSQRAGHHLSQ